MHNRSILILTPERALKFTAVSADRHYLWLKALSFLVHSASDQPMTLPLPSNQRLDGESLIRFGGSSSRRGANRETLNLVNNNANDEPTLLSRESSTSNVFVGVIDEPVTDAANPPNIPRFYQGRLRSNTGSRLSRTVTTHRTFSQAQQVYSRQVTRRPDGYNGLPFGLSRPMNEIELMVNSRASETEKSMDSHNLHEANGTRRMEAFIEPIWYENSTQALPGINCFGASLFGSEALNQNPSFASITGATEAINPFRGF